MENSLKKIDIDVNIGSITLTNGGTLEVPKISMLKIIKIVKFLGIDATKLYYDFSEIVNDKELDDMTKVVTIMEGLKEEQLIRVFSILLDVSDKEALSLDPNETLDIVLLYLDKTNISKTFTQVRQIYKKMFNNDLPDIKKWIAEKVEANQQLQERREAILAAAEKESGNPL